MRTILIDIHEIRPSSCFEDYRIYSQPYIKTRERRKVNKGDKGAEGSVDDVVTSAFYHAGSAHS